MGQRKITHTKFIKKPQNRNAGVDGVSSLNANHRGDLSITPRRFDIFSFLDELQIIRVFSHQSLDNVDLPQCQL